MFNASPKVPRTIRVAETLKVVLEEVIQRDIQDPDIGFHSITHIDLSADLYHAKIFISLFGDEAKRDKTFAALCRDLKEIRKHVGQKMKLRSVPELHLVKDDSLEKGDKILNKLKELKKEREANHAQS